jgi:hypothetical protein
MNMEEQCSRYKLPDRPAYASIIPSRYSSTVKMHSGIGTAKAAIAYHRSAGKARGGEIHEWRDDAWHLLYRVEAGTPTTELPWRKK